MKINKIVVIGSPDEYECKVYRSLNNSIGYSDYASVTFFNTKSLQEVEAFLRTEGKFFVINHSGVSINTLGIDINIDYIMPTENPTIEQKVALNECIRKKFS